MRDVAGPSQSVGDRGSIPPRRGVSAHKGAHGAFWRIAMGMAGALFWASSSYAVKVSNSFVTVEGEGVGILDDGSITHDQGATGDIIVTARPGWRVNGQKSVSINPARGSRQLLGATSDLHEGQAHVHVFPSSVSNEHATAEISAEAVDAIAMYALPDTTTPVSVSATCKVVKPGLHAKYKVYGPCSGCGVIRDPAVELIESKAVEPDDYEWTAEGPGLTVKDSTWEGVMTKGLNQKISFTVKGTRKGCPACECTATAEATVDVHELSVERPDYIGFDMTDAKRGRYIYRSATAKIDPAPAAAEYEWQRCGRCEFYGATNKEVATYRVNDEAGPSGSYLEEDLVVKATARNNDGLSAEANCITNFTVVRVDVALSGVGEDGDETALPGVVYAADADDGELTKFGLRSLKPVQVFCCPCDIPGDVNVTITPGAKIYEITEYTGDNASELVPSAAVPAKPSYPCDKIASVAFGIHGHSRPDYEKVMAAGHPKSGAVDKVMFNVVLPPPLEVAVKLDSPAEGGGWPYDPVWDDPEWAPTVNGSLAEKCAADTDNALVIYTLSRDASKVDGVICKRSIPLLPGSKVDSFVGLTSEGVHTNSWDIGPTRDTGAYYAEVVAIEKETGEPRDAKSDDGEVVRHSYCTAPGVSPVMTCQYICPVQWEEHLLDNGERYVTVTLMIIDPVLLTSGLAKAVGVSVACVAVATGVIEHVINGIISFTTTIGTVPNWLQPGVSVFGCSWKVIRWEWDDGKYVKAGRVTVPGLPHSPESTVINGEFEIGYLCYAQFFRPKDGVLGPRYNPLHSGFYCNETTSSDDKNIGYQLQDGWRWNAKWWGLLQPIIEVPQVQQVD